MSLWRWKYRSNQPKLLFFCQVYVISAEKLKDIYPKPMVLKVWSVYGVHKRSMKLVIDANLWAHPRSPELETHRI